MFDLAAEFEALSHAFPADHPAARHLHLLDEALRRDLHFVARHRASLFQCLWNSCWWYDHPAASPYYEPSEPGYEPPPWARPGPKLFEWIEAWRQTRAASGAKGPWLRSMRPPAIQLGGCQRAVLETPEGAIVQGLTFVREGERIVGGLVRESVDGVKVSSIAVWDTRSGEELPGFPEHVGDIGTLSGSPDGTRIVSGS